MTRIQAMILWFVEHGQRRCDGIKAPTSGCGARVVADQSGGSKRWGVIAGRHGNSGVNRGTGSTGLDVGASGLHRSVHRRVRAKASRHEMER